ncbi:hypothetical protein [Lacrimispora sphenoides]|uniref:hypothetical protein n=1 Tax=Lacrimispora sphenoides TaxID=29370 RepID=UPI000B858A11|nr:hypothetical protein [Lacrimispora sphenoides]
MVVCRTLDYIVNTDLNSLLSEKFNYAKSCGIEIEIELTEPIDNLIIKPKGFFKIMDRLLEDAFQSIKGSDEKKMLFCMFYKNGDLWCLVKYHFLANDNQHFSLEKYNKKLAKTMKGYRTISNIEYEDSVITRFIIMLK